MTTDGSSGEGATAIVVAFGIEALDLSWLPTGAPAIVVRNDELLDPSKVAQATVITPDGNVGFGAAIDLALAQVRTPRVVLVNPDLLAGPAHWAALAQGADNEVGVVPINDGAGRATIVVSRYPGPMATMAGGWRLGRFLPRHSWLRAMILRFSGAAARDQAKELAGRTPGRFPLSSYWASFALVSLPTAAVGRVGGLGGRYFLYFEDVDLCRRLSRALPDGTIVLHDVAPAVHSVGQAGGRSRAAERHRYRSAILWASQDGAGWAAARAVLRLRTLFEPGFRG